MCRYMCDVKIIKFTLHSRYRGALYTIDEGWLLVFSDFINLLLNICSLTACLGCEGASRDRKKRHGLAPSRCSAFGQALNSSGSLVMPARVRFHNSHVPGSSFTTKTFCNDSYPKPLTILDQLAKAVLGVANSLLGASSTWRRR